MTENSIVAVTAALLRLTDVTALSAAPRKAGAAAPVIPDVETYIPKAEALLHAVTERRHFGQTR